MADTVAGLYFAGGAATYPGAARTAASALATALRGHSGPGQIRRSRLAEHLLGPAVHRTHPAVAAVYSWFLQCSSMCARRLLDLESLQFQWDRRRKCTGPLPALACALQVLNIAWPQLGTLQSGPIHLLAAAAALPFSPGGTWRSLFAQQSGA